MRDDLYLAPAADLLRAVQNLGGDVRAALLIGHNPGLHELALGLLATFAPQKPKLGHRLSLGFPTGALAEFRFSGHWAKIETETGELRRFLRPKDLLSPAA